MNALLLLIAVAPPRMELVHEMHGSILANTMIHGLNDKPLFGAPARSMIVAESTYERIEGKRYRIRSRLEYYSPGRWNRGPCEIPTFTDQLISVRVTHWDGRVEVVR